MAGKQAKVLTDAQVKTLLRHIEDSRYPVRNRVIALLSIKAGLRAKEIAGLDVLPRWRQKEGVTLAVPRNNRDHQADRYLLLSR